jgi:FAS-associated factor 2
LSFLPHLPRFLRPPSPATRRPPNTTSYIRDLELSTGSTTLPDLYAGPYREFVSTVRKEGKVGLVIITCGEHEDDEEFKRDVLCDGELIKVLKEKEVLIWAGDVRSREGYQGESYMDWKLTESCLYIARYYLPDACFLIPTTHP